MKVSYNWLKEYVTFDLDPVNLASKLTMAGFEVEEISALIPEFSGITVAEVQQVGPHPNADKLSVCKVRTGSELLDVICGAPNVHAGQKVAFAKIGTVLPGGIKIKKAKIRDVYSYGMICSEQELGLKNHSEGIWVLPDSWRLDEKVYEKIQNRQDYILDIAVTPNRPDALSIVGIAREIAVLEKTGLNLPDINFTLKNTGSRKEFDVQIEKDTYPGCPRYTARIIRNVKLASSPDWLIQRLQAVGVRPINNVVDITNFVLFEFGHPLHAFDLHRLKGDKIIVRYSKTNESFTTLDKVDRPLPDKTVLICDAEKAVAIGGIMGGLNSEVAEGTTDILLESAYFDPVHVAYSSKKLGLTTEASQRFERGADPNGAIRASDRATALIVEIAGGSVADDIIDCYPEPIEPKKVSVRFSRVNKVLGTSLKKSEMTDILNGLELLYDNETVTVPTFRPDIEREVDIIEEIARVINYDTIPVAQRLSVRMDGELNPADLLFDRIKTVCCELGMTEVINNSMVSRREIEAINDRAHVKILNPISDDMNVMRPSLLPGILKVTAYNINRQYMDLHLFELGRIFAEDASVNPDQQMYTLAFMLHGGRYQKSWEGEVPQVDLYDIKGRVTEFCKKIFLDNLDFILYDRNGYFREGYALSVIYQGENLGSFGQIKPEIAAVFGIESPVFGSELYLREMESLYMRPVQYQPFSRFPAVEKDLALIVDEGIAADTLKKFIQESGAPLAQETAIFDFFRGKHIQPGKKSIGFRIRFQSKERTLTDKEVLRVFEKIIKQVERKYQAKLRD